MRILDRLRHWKNPYDVKDVKPDTYNAVRFVLWTILFANFIVAAVKILIGCLIKSNSLSADGIHSLTDGSSNIVGLIGIHFAFQPEDRDHPYGHKKFETLSSLFIAGMLAFLGIRIVSTAFTRFIHPVSPEVTTESLIALILTLIVNIFVSRYEYKKGQTLHSDILIADSCHTKSDIYVSLGVLLTLVGIKLGLPPMIDPIASLIVSGFILYAAYEILIPTVGVLADKAVIDPEIIREVALSFEQVKDVHKIRSRGRNDDIQVDLHVLLDPAMNVKESHELSHAISQRLNEQLGGNIHAVIHIEPDQEECCGGELD
jgi:cation diffusion facilitator family transporter